jgi:diadenosine hexaphosphate hydrolase (ATP-forming)
MKIKNTENKTVKAGCVVINDQQKILLILHDQSTDTWAFPKGHLEANETLEQAAIRETLEETGYTVRIIQQLPDLVYANEKTNEAIHVTMFLAKPIGEPTAITEVIGSAWFTLEEAKTKVYPNLVNTIETVARL